MTVTTELEIPDAFWERLHKLLADVQETPRHGRVVHLVGLGIEAEGPDASVGEVLTVTAPGRPPLLAEVVGFRNGRVLLMPLGDMSGIGPGALVTSTGSAFPHSRRRRAARPGPRWLGQADRRGPKINPDALRLVESDPPHPLARVPIESPLRLGIRAIDGFCTVGKGQRIGIFCGQRRRQKHADGDGGSRNRGRRQCHLLSRRAGP